MKSRFHSARNASFSQSKHPDPPPGTSTQETQRNRARSPKPTVALLSILVLAAIFRLQGLDWDQGCHLHPDDRFLTMVASSLKWPSSLLEYLDQKRSPLNPRNAGFPRFVYGTLPTTTVRALAEITGQTGYDQIYLLGRGFSASLDLGAIIILFGLVQLLYRDHRMALLASFLLATSVLPIQQSHFFVVDTFANFLALCTLYWLARLQLSGKLSHYLLTGLFLAMAMACKISIATLALLVVAVGVLRVVQAWQLTRSFAGAWLEAERTFWSLIATGVLTLAVFHLCQPDAFQNPGRLLTPSNRWLENLNLARNMVTGEMDFPPGHQWAFRLNLWFPWKNMVLWGMGPALGIIAWIGWAAALWRILVRQQWIHLIPVGWVALVFFQHGTQWVKTLRYFLPAYPLLALLAAWLLIRLLQKAKTVQRAKTGTGRPLWLATTARCMLGAVAVTTLLWATAFTAIYRRPHTRITASRWIYQHLGEDSVLAHEHWDDALPLNVDGADPDRYASRVELKWYDDDTLEKLVLALDWLERADYIILSSNRLSHSIPRLPMRYPMTTRYYQALFDESLGWKRVAEFTAYPKLFGVEIPDQGAEEAFTVHDHPKVLIFKKKKEYSRQRALQVLAEVDWGKIVRKPARELSR